MSTPASRRDEIVLAALHVLDADGLDGVTLRAVAKQLGVQLNTVTWHIRNKPALLEFMADAILAGAEVTDLPPTWDAALRELARRYRAALLAHRDGAVLVTGVDSGLEHTLRLADAIVGCLLDGGFDEQDAAWTCWTVSYFTLGLTAEEQRATTGQRGALSAAISPTRHPALARSLPQLADFRFTARFEYGLDLMIDGLTTRRGVAD